MPKRLQISCLTGIVLHTRRAFSRGGRSSHFLRGLRVSRRDPCERNDIPVRFRRHLSVSGPVTKSAQSPHLSSKRAPTNFSLGGSGVFFETSLSITQASKTADAFTIPMAGQTSRLPAVNKVLRNGK